MKRDFMETEQIFWLIFGIIMAVLLFYVLSYAIGPWAAGGAV